MARRLDEFADYRNLRQLSREPSTLTDSTMFERVTSGTIRSLTDFLGSVDATTIFVDAARTDAYTPDGSILYPYRTLEDAVAAMSTARPRVLLLPGTYLPPASISLALSGGTIEGLGRGVTIDGAASVAQVFDIDPAAAATTWGFTLRGLSIRTVEAQVGIQVDNASVARNIILTLSDVSITNKSGTPGNAVDVDHANTSFSITLNIYGRGPLATTFTKAINFAQGNASDRINIESVWLKGGFALGSGTQAMRAVLMNYAIAHQGFSGGAVENLVTSVRGVTESSGTWAAVDADDDAGASYVLTIV
jgi:hypothetical protein